MRKSLKITFSGLCASLATIIMITAYFPYLTYATPAIASLVIMVCFIEIDAKWALGCYLASILPIFLTAEIESKILYIVFFGYYPILKAVIEKVKSRALEWFLKILTFNGIVILVYCLSIYIFGFKLEELGDLGIYSLYVLLFLGNVIFILYDMCIERIAALYMLRLHNSVKKFLNR